jgi:hypothetical protein
MEHTVEIIDRKNLSNGQFAVLLQCCNQSCCLRTDCREQKHTCCIAGEHTCQESWHSFCINHKSVIDVDLMAELEAAKLRISQTHEVMLGAAQFFDNLASKDASTKAT